MLRKYLKDRYLGWPLLASGIVYGLQVSSHTRAGHLGRMDREAIRPRVVALLVYGSWFITMCGMLASAG